MKKIKKFIISLLLACISFFTSIGAPIVTAFADDSSSKGNTAIEYTSPLEDLEKSGDFDKSTYPVKADDYSLSVITVAESENLQLFVYVYQPSYGTKSLVASSINIATEINNQLKFTNYKLSLLTVDGVFQKYVVDGLIVNSNEVRNYQISSIFRIWDSTIDQGLEATNENTIDEVVFEVAKIYTFDDSSGKTRLSVSDVDTIEITSKYVGFVRYEEGHLGWGDLSIYEPGIDSHFIAFSTDRTIDYLYQADVYYSTQSYKHTKNLVQGETDTFGEIEEKYAYLTYEDKVSVDIPNGFFDSYNYEWGRIQTVNEFISTEDREFVYSNGIFNVITTTKITDEGLEDLQDKQWVLRFAETKQGTYTSGTGNNPILDIDVTEYTIVSNVTILRLLFESDGVPYNLGVIDNKQSGSTTPDNETEISIELAEEWWQKLVSLLFLVVLLVILMPILTPILGMVFGLIFQGVGVIIKIIFNILTFPLRLIGKLFTKK